jgi:hypothetical protein
MLTGYSYQEDGFDVLIAASGDAGSFAVSRNIQ